MHVKLKNYKSLHKNNTDGKVHTNVECSAKTLCLCMKEFLLHVLVIQFYTLFNNNNNNNNNNILKSNDRKVYLSICVNNVFSCEYISIFIFIYICV